jgi:preprotein translocase subunit SecA
MAKFRLFGGGRTEDTLERCRTWTNAVNAAEGDTHRLSDAGLRQAIRALRQRHESGESLDALLPETFAIVREAAVRTIGERPYDEQLIGGAALHQGSVVEMKTGEGKTLTAVLPACLHALAGRGVHVMTANDYLAARDADWMGPIYRFLGLSCAMLAKKDSHAERHTIYDADIVYGTPAEFAYDYLRDNMAWAKNEVVQRDRFSAIVDETDLVMLDEAGIQPQLFGSMEVKVDYAGPAKLAARLEPGVHYVVDKARGTVSPTERGMAAIEDSFGAAIYNGGDVGLAHQIGLALKAKELYVKDRDYAVVDGTVRIIDVTTQRVLLDRTLGDGLDQALDAKEGLEIRPEQQVVAVIDGRSYLRLHPRLAGLTGVVEAEVEAYQDLYGLECVRVPPHRPVRRVDHDPMIYNDDALMLRAVSKTVEQKRSTGRPVLVGTSCDEMAALISARLNADGIEHDVLAAKNHEREAEITARAGRPGAVTVLTRMAGRGVDIRLAEPEGEGLYVLGVGPLASRRLELHLRGRAGRGGDPGESALFVSLNDPHLHVPERVERFANAAAGAAAGEEPIHGRLVTRSITGKLDAMSAFASSSLVRAAQYSDVQDERRAAVYARRADILENGLQREDANDVIAKTMRNFVLAARLEPGDVNGFAVALRDHYPATITRDALATGLTGGPSSKARTELAEAVVRDALAASATREAQLGNEVASELRRRVMLSVMDRRWVEYLRDLGNVYDGGLNLRTAAGGDSLTEYQRAASRMATTMWQQIGEDFVGYWFTLEVTPKTD